MTITRIIRVALAIAGMLLVASSVWGSSGDSLWKIDFTIPNYPSITITAMSVSQTSIIICGTASGGMTPQQIGFVKAFDVATGGLRWDHELMLGSQSNSYTAITVEGGIALVLGTAYGGWIPDPPPGHTFSKSIVRACYADTGLFLWENQQDIYQMAPMPIASFPPFMATANNRTFLAGVISTGAALPGTCVVQAFQLKSAQGAATMLLLD